MPSPGPTPGDQPLPVPSGWYCLGFVDELPAGVVHARRLAGRELVVIRTGDAVAVLDAYCPHLGAHLAVGGAIEAGPDGPVVRCPFHGFRFDLAGRCVSTPYGGKVPPTAQLRAWPARERHGLVLCWYGATGEPPAFEVPAWPTEGWTPWRHHRFVFRGHPQEVAENSVDLGHFGPVHRYRAIETLAPLELDGAVLRARYAFERAPFLPWTAPVRVNITIHQWGLGHALVEGHTEPIGVDVRNLVLALPVEQDQLELRIGFSTRWVERPGRVHPLLAFLPGRFVAERIADLGIRQYVSDVGADVPIWAHKAHLRRPALAEGDGPVGRYRRWAAQFLPASP